MGKRAGISRDAQALSYVIEIVDEVVGKTAARSATRHDHAVARAALRFLVATANRVEVDLAHDLSERHITALNWVRRTCARYEAMLWQPTPIFLRS